MVHLVIETLVILFGPGLLALVAAYDVQDIKPEWKNPLIRIGVFLLIVGGILFLLLLKACSDLAQHPVQ
jgi:hypothetical protein